MAISRSILKQYFLTGKKPTQQQFAALIDSFLHITDDKISVSNIEGLSGILAGKASVAQYNLMVEQYNSVVEKLNNLRPEPIAVSGQETYQLDWSEELRARHGDYGHFEVWMNGTLQQVPIRFFVDEEGGDGKPVSYSFTLDNNDALIFII